MKLNYKYRLCPNKTQINSIEQHIFFYNQAWDIVVDELNNYDEYLSICNAKNITPDKFKTDTELDRMVKAEFVKRAYVDYKTTVLQAARKDAKTAHFAIKAKKKSTGKFVGKLKHKSENMNGQGFKLNDGQFSVFFSGNQAYLRFFSMNIKLKLHRNIPKGFRITSVVIKFQNNRFHATFSITDEPIKKKNISKDAYKKLLEEFPKQEDLEAKADEHTENVMGLDMNINAIDIGNKDIHLRFDTKDLKKLDVFKKKAKVYKKLVDKQARRQSKAIQTQTKLGKNFYKDQAKINKLHRKARNIKSDYLHKKCWEIIRTLQENGVKHLFLEDLDVLKMLSKKNVVELLGVRKSRVMRVNMKKKGFGELPRQLIFKLFKLYQENSENKIYFTKVNPRNTSRRCSCCGKIKEGLTLKDRTYKCDECGLSIDRDWNACINISSVW